MGEVNVVDLVSILLLPEGSICYYCQLLLQCEQGDFFGACSGGHGVRL